MEKFSRKFPIMEFIYELHPAFIVFILPISRNYVLFITLGSKSKKEVYEVTVQNPIKIEVVMF